MNYVSTLAVLERARELVSNKETWCRGADARNDRGISVGTGSPEAVKFCSQGALQRAVQERVGLVGYTSTVVSFQPIPRATEDTMRVYRIAYDYLNRVSIERYRMSIINVNDDLGREAALECFDIAIQTVKRDARFQRPRRYTPEYVGLATIVKEGDLALPTTPKVATFTLVDATKDNDSIDPELERLLLEANAIESAAEGLADKVLASV